MNLTTHIPPAWQPILQAELTKPYFVQLQAFLAAEYGEHTIFPPAEEIFSALDYTPYDQVQVLIVGQDPYHDDGQAHGLAFSVRPGVKVPPSLVNMYKELESDVGIPRATHGYLKRWTEQGVLLLNTSLTVRAHEAGSHKGKGWEQCTDAIIRAVAAKPERVVFVLWGAHAQKKAELITHPYHVILKAAHPSPLSATQGFFGSKPFSAINAALTEVGKAPIDWNVGSA